MDQIIRETTVNRKRRRKEVLKVLQRGFN